MGDCSNDVWIKHGRGGGFKGYSKTRRMPEETSEKQTAQREKFSAAAHACKGAGSREQFNSCMSQKLSAAPQGVE